MLSKLRFGFRKPFSLPISDPQISTLTGSMSIFPATKQCENMKSWCKSRRKVAKSNSIANDFLLSPAIQTVSMLHAHTKTKSHAISLKSQPVPNIAEGATGLHAVERILVLMTPEVPLFIASISAMLITLLGTTEVWQTHSTIMLATGWCK